MQFTLQMNFTKRYPTKGEYVNCSNVVLREFDDNVLVNRLNKIKNMQKQ